MTDGGGSSGCSTCIGIFKTLLNMSTFIEVHKLLKSGRSKFLCMLPVPLHGSCMVLLGRRRYMLCTSGFWCITSRLYIMMNESVPEIITK